MANGSLEARREGLLRWLNAARAQGSARNRMTVIFDGQPGHFGGMGGGEIKVIFSDGQNADECIKNIVDCARDPKNFVVVSDDKGIRLYVRALGARVLGVKEFAESLFKRAAGKASNPGVSEGQKVNMTQADQINKELERLWIK